MYFFPPHPHGVRMIFLRQVRAAEGKSRPQLVAHIFHMVTAEPARWNGKTHSPDSPTTMVGEAVRGGKTRTTPTSRTTRKACLPKKETPQALLHTVISTNSCFQEGLSLDCAGARNGALKDNERTSTRASPSAIFFFFQRLWLRRANLLWRASDDGCADCL